MAPKVPFEDAVAASHYDVIKSDLKKAKTAITSQLSILNKEMVNLGKTPTPTLYKKGLTWQPLTTPRHLRGGEQRTFKNNATPTTSNIFWCEVRQA